jgi:hypothetical protein
VICEEFTYDTYPRSSILAIGIMDSTFLENDLMTGSYEQIIDPNSFAVSYKWNLHKEGSGETKLIVEAAGYDNWAPVAAMNEEDAGQMITFQARLIEEDGTSACATADSFTFELIDVSHEPGVCLNYPRAELAGKDYDLHFKEELNNPDDVMSPDRLTLQTLGGKDAAATVASFDWGAYGTLKVTAHMPGGKTITGFLSGHPEITDILIPKRSPGSKIADKWKQDHGVEGLADDDDSESEPVGDGNPGDGFTLYEEYRGFYVKGEPTGGDPKIKDLFVFTNLGAFLPGIQFFKAVTGLNVHSQLYDSEFDTTLRVMNFNHLEEPHSVDQHGLWIKLAKKQEGASISYTHLGPPKNAGPLNISPESFKNQGFATVILDGGRKEITNLLNQRVAHELGHAVHISHHSVKEDCFRYWTNDSSGLWEIYPAEPYIKYIEPRWEDDTPCLSGKVGLVWIAIWAGEHSGFSDCIMRYDVASAYIPGSQSSSTIRYMVNGNERTGILLCDKKEDSPGGVNYIYRKPRPRYGSAAKGDCVHQICINDKYY